MQVLFASLSASQCCPQWLVWLPSECHQSLGFSPKFTFTHVDIFSSYATLLCSLLPHLWLMTFRCLCSYHQMLILQSMIPCSFLLLILLCLACLTAQTNVFSPFYYPFCPFPSLQLFRVCACAFPCSVNKCICTPSQSGSLFLTCPFYDELFNELRYVFWLFLHWIVHFSQCKALVYCK